MTLSKHGGVRYTILLMLFVVSALSYGDRVTLSVAGTALSRSLHLDALKLGYLLSGFSWAYVVGQLPAGGLLDRFGSKRVYGLSIVAWSIFALLVGFAGYLPAAIAFTVIFALRLASGLAQSPVFPGNGRIVATWFPSVERGMASAIFNAAQYFALVLFAPILGWITQSAGWQPDFWFMGLLALAIALVWFRVMYNVKDHPRVSRAEIDFIESGGGLVNTDDKKRVAKQPRGLSTLSVIRVLLGSRMLVGIYIGQYCITTLTWFFLTWFPIYLEQARHMPVMKVGLVAAVPAFVGSVGGILGGLVSDRLLRAGYSLSFARKLPIVTGMLLAVTIIACNYFSAQWVIILILSLAFFGKGFGALGWTVVSDTSPVGMVGINGGLFNFIGNLSGISTPIVIGYLVKRTHSFNDALVYVGLTAVMAIISYVFVAGEIKRLVLPQVS